MCPRISSYMKLNLQMPYPPISRPFLDSLSPQWKAGFSFIFFSGLSSLVCQMGKGLGSRRQSSKHSLISPLLRLCDVPESTLGPRDAVSDLGNVQSCGPRVTLYKQLHSETLIRLMLEGRMECCSARQKVTWPGPGKEKQEQMRQKEGSSEAHCWNWN